MDKLPLEVWQIVFEYSLPYPHLDSILKSSGFEHVFQGEFSFSHSRTVLCLVSRKWKEWIYGTPTLWSTIVIYAHIPPSKENVKRWCLLSGNCPLDIYADPLTPRPSTNQLQDLWDMPTPRYHHGFPELVDLFRTNAFRIRRLVIANWDEIQTSLSLIFPATSTVRRLEVLVVLRYSQSGDKNDTPKFDNVEAPNLHTLCMMPSLWSPLASEWCPSLRSLKISAEGLQPAFFQNISSFSHLEYLEIRPVHPYLLWNLADWLGWHTSQISLEIALPALKHISIASDPSGLTSIILQHVKSETLVSVTFKGNKGEVNSLSTLRDLRGINRIQYLKLECVHFGKEAEEIIRKSFCSLNVIHFIESLVDQTELRLKNMPHGLKKIISERSTFPVLNNDEYVPCGEIKKGCIELEVDGVTYFLKRHAW